MMTLEEKAFESCEVPVVAAAPVAPRNAFAPEVVSRLLDKLSSDDEFRALFQVNPREALRLCGHVTPEHLRDIKHEDPVLCCYNIRNGLASKETIRDARARVAAILTNTLPLGMFAICVD